MKLYHNPRCSKSRQALATCEAQGVGVQVLEYLKDPPSLEELRSIWEALGRDIEVMSRAAEIKKAGLEPSLELLAENPQYLQRPILVNGDRVAVCRTPEEIEAFLRGL